MKRTLALERSVCSSRYVGGAARGGGRVYQLQGPLVKIKS